MGASSTGVRQRAARGLQRSERIADLGSHGVHGGAVRAAVDGAIVVEGPANNAAHPLAVAYSFRRKLPARSQNMLFSVIEETSGVQSAQGEEIETQDALRFHVVIPTPGQV